MFQTIPGSESEEVHVGQGDGEGNTQTFRQESAEETSSLGDKDGRMSLEGEITVSQILQI